MSYIESVKSYTGNTLEEIFFRPMLKADSIQDLGIRMLYNMPLPTTVHLWSTSSDPLRLFDSDSSGWSGGSSSTKEQKLLDMTRIKAEMAFSAHDYFSLVFENITSRSDINFEDLTGTELEAAETELFRQSLQEAIRVTMWLGDGSLSSDYNAFKGFLTLANEGFIEEEYTGKIFDYSDISDDIYAVLDSVWDISSEELKSLKSDGELAFFVSSEVYYNYEKYLESTGNEAAYSAIIEGRRELYFRGIPVIDIRIGKYKSYASDASPCVILADKRNMVVAFNTSDLPGAEVRMWYNPDEMENRQRAVFMIGCDFIDPNLLTFARFVEEEEEEVEE